MAHNLRMQIFPSFKMQFSLKKTKNQKQKQKTKAKGQYLFIIIFLFLEKNHKAKGGS